MKSKWFLKMLFSYLPLFFIMISVLVFIFFLAVNEVAERENERANETFSNYIVQQLDNELQSLNQTFLNDVYFADDTQLFLNPLYQDDIELNYRLIQRLQAFTRHSEFVDSVYVYRKADHTVLSNVIMIDADLYLDNNFVLEGRREIEWSDMRLFSDVMDSTSRQVVSSKRPYPLAGDSRGWLVMNLNVNALQRLISDIGRVDLSYVYVTDSAGQYVMGNIPQKEAQEAQPELTLKSDTTGWTFHSGLKENYLFNSFKLISRIWIMSGGLIIVAGFAWLIYLIRRNYKPVEALAARISGYSLRKSMELHGNYDEFKFIENTLDDLLENAHSQNEQLKQNMLYKEKFLFQSLVEGTNAANWTDLAHVLSAKGFSEEGKGWGIVLAEMDYYRGFEQQYSRRDQLLLKFALQCVIKEMADKYRLPVWAEWVSDKQIGMLVQVEEDGHSEASLQAFYSEALRWVELNLSFTVTLAAGSRVDSLDEIYISYDSSLELMHLKPTIGNNRWIDESQVKSITGLGYYQLLPDVHALTESFRMGKASWTERMALIYERIQAQHMSRKEIVHLFEYVLHKLNSELGDVADPSGVFWNEREIESLQRLIDSFDTVEDLFDGFKQLLNEVYERMLSWREENGNLALLDRAQAYIEQRYGDPDLSLNHVSDVFGMNPAHFSRTFKMGTGEKFIDYITRIRIEHAKQRLAETDDAIHDIGVAVGYIHAVSFNRAFKKALGLTPGDYRKMVANTDEGRR